MKTKKVLRYLIIIVVLLLIFMAVGKRKGWVGNKVNHEVTIEKSEKRTIIETITADGKIQPETEVKISPDVSGEIVELNVIEGQQIKEGDLLLKIKPDIYLSNLARMEAALNSTKAQLSQSEAQLLEKENSHKRNTGLWEKNAISKAEFEASEAAFKISEASYEASKFAVKSSEASLKEANENFTKTTIYAPISGTISKLHVEKGERVVGTAQMAGTEILRIANLNLMEVKVDVNENDIVKVSLGDTALIEIDAYADMKFKGIVTEIANSANTAGVSTDQVTSFDVKVRILQSSYEDLIPEDEKNFYPFRPGMSANVDIQTEIQEEILTVPIIAVTTRADTTKSKLNGDESDDKDDLKEVVFIYSDGIVLQREVKTGIQDNNYINIKSGIVEGDEIVVAPYSEISRKLKDSIKVEVVKKEELFKEDEK